MVRASFEARPAFVMSSAATAFTNLVNVRGRNCLRVAPCNPDESSLSAVIHERAGCGVSHGRPHLGSAEVESVDAWIRAGAR